MWPAVRELAVRRRLDTEMVRRGVSVTRAEAALAIRSGRVTVAGRPAAKAGMLIADDEPIVMTGPGRRFVSRGGEKLEAALVRFGIEVGGRRALDAGASTGGFTDCLLQRGAEHVVAVDVGYGQLDWRLREDPRVTVLERANARGLDPMALPYAADLVTADLSFISLGLVLPALERAAAEVAELMLLVKPQFEAGRQDVGSGGVVSDPGVWERVLSSVAGQVRELGFEVWGMMASPRLGPAGNVEFLLSAGRPPRAAGKSFDLMVKRAMDEGRELRAHGEPA